VNRWILRRGDCREFLTSLPENFADAAVTDPPYELNFMGRDWDRTGIAFDPSFWAEVLRVLKPGAYLLAAGIGWTHHRVMVAVEDAGFEIRDCVYHAFSSGWPKNLDVSKEIGRGAGAAQEAARWRGFGTALKPTVEIWILARKPLSEKTVAENVLRWGVGALNVDGCRIPYRGETDPRTFGGAWRTDKAGSNAYGGGWRGEPQKVSPLGRWPANLVLSHSEECRVKGCRRIRGTGR
jgi:site-specific DNA-methyltransferase (adenine-specific)